ncbi:MAG: division/cell wall cluster transcriptional repressor MraZ [Candidatus Limnocylindrales bacterium]
MFTGEYRHAIDAKGRVAVPARFRAELAVGAFVSRWIDSCLAIFPRPEWERLADRVSELPFSDAGARVFSRFVFSGAFEFTLDAQGRLVLPPALREFATLKDDAVVVGARDHIELWEPGQWAAYSAEMNSADALAARIADLGI